MKKLTILMSMISLLFLVSLASAGTFSSGSTGADGAFNPTANTEVQLPADGILNYTTVNILSGVTVTFKKNSNNTPVYILATGDVTISGTISVNGSSASGIYPGEGGVGGFGGGHGGVQNTYGGRGLGHGGGNPGTSLLYSAWSGYYGDGGGGGGFGSSGGSNQAGGSGTYGNERLIPMIGGSGGGGGRSYSYTGTGGGGGAGAVLIASSGTISVTGTITANGGNGATATYTGGSGGSGSGGAIRLIANTISGNGTISANGGTHSAAGGNGRIRIETYNLTRTSGTSPTYSFGKPGSVFVANTPSLQITSIGGTSVPSGAEGSYLTPDITLSSSTTNPVSIGISAANIPVGTSVSVYAMPQFGSASSASVTLSGTDSSSTATASLSISTSYTSVIMAWTTFTVQTAMYYEGEKIEKVKVAATMGKGSEVTYITESGKEIPAYKMQDT
jgi:hypothetical protein